MASRPFHVLSLFSGGGGLDLGIGLAVRGTRTVCYVEREAFAAAILVARMADATLDPAPIWDDVVTFDGKPWRGLVDCVAGGFPCQDISLAGKGGGVAAGARSGLWREFARIVRDVGPRYVFVENVAALVRRGLDHVLGDLARLGFDAEWDVFSAAEVGAPHLRKRLFLLARHVSDAKCGGVRVVTERDQRQGRQEGTPVGGDAEPGDVGADLADADLARLEGPPGPDRGGERPVGTGRDGGNGDIPAWPPGPCDTDGWAFVLERWPDLAPAVKPEIRRVAYGSANRNDRLRLLGNGVVPAVAARAWRVLEGRLMPEEK